MTEEHVGSISHLKQLQIESTEATYNSDWQRVADITSDMLLVVEHLLINQRIDAVERGVE